MTQLQSVIIVDTVTSGNRNECIVIGPFATPDEARIYADELLRHVEWKLSYMRAPISQFRRDEIVGR